jgi:hypothetical protein
MFLLKLGANRTAVNPGDQPGIGREGKSARVVQRATPDEHFGNIA